MKKRTLVSIAFILPSVIIVGIFVYAFIAWTLAVSFTNWNTLLPNWSFAGLKNPMAISLVVSGVIWIWIYDPTNGALASLFQILHLPSINWLGSMTYALPAIIIATIWQYTGFTTSIYLAGLRGIPQEILEAARLDGAHGLRLYWNIIIPMVQSSTVTAFVLMVQLSLQMFDIVWVMTQGGPAFATDMPAVYMFIAGFKQNFVAKGAAIAIVIFALTLVVVIPYLFTVGKITEEEA